MTTKSSNPNPQTTVDHTVLPDDLLFDFDLTVTEHPDPDSDVTITGVDWESALYYDHQTIADMLDERGFYHMRLAASFLVAARFEFSVDDNDTIIAHGTLHPAEEHRGDYHTHEHETLMTATVEIRPKSPKTADAMRMYIRECLIAPAGDIMDSPSNPT